jgi:hypothetical protein
MERRDANLGSVGKELAVGWDSALVFHFKSSHNSNVIHFTCAHAITHVV